MAIAFLCPKCKGLCAFKDQYAGKRARCTTCQTRFIIPDKDGGKPVLVKVEYYDDGDAVSGFYRAVFVESWGMFGSTKNITGLVLVLAAVVFKFILANRNISMSVHVPATGGNVDVFLPFGSICEGVCWGVIFWYYMEIIYSVAFGNDELPTLNIKSAAELFGKGVMSAYYFMLTLFIVFLPSVIILIVNSKIEADIKWAAYVAAIISGVLFPAAILRVSVMQDIYSLLRIDRLIYPLIKIPRQYGVVTVLVIITIVVEHFTNNYNRAIVAEPYLIALNLTGKLVGQVPGLVAMRSVGLLFRHYEGYAI